MLSKRRKSGLHRPRVSRITGIKMHLEKLLHDDRVRFQPPEKAVVDAGATDSFVTGTRALTPLHNGLFRAATHRSCIIRTFVLSSFVHCRPRPSNKLDSGTKDSSAEIPRTSKKLIVLFRTFALWWCETFTSSLTTSATHFHFPSQTNIIC